MRFLFDKMTDKLILMDSRKAFFLEYVMALIALLILFAIAAKGLEVNGMFTIIISTAAIAGLIMPEIKRIKKKCIITHESVTVKSGILNKREHQFQLSTITDVNYHQNLWQRLLGYGTLVIRSFSHAGREIYVGNIDNPKKVMVAISKLVGQKLEKMESKPTTTKGE